MTEREACDALNAAGLVAGPVATDAEVVADPHLAGRHMLVEHPRTDGVGQPVLDPRTAGEVRRGGRGSRDAACPGSASTPTRCWPAELGLGPAELAQLACRRRDRLSVRRAAQYRGRAMKATT